LSSCRGRSPKLAAFVAFAGPLDLLTRVARRSSLYLKPIWTWIVLATAVAGAVLI
jgi:hypothetical protein